MRWYLCFSLGLLCRGRDRVVLVVVESVVVDVGWLGRRVMQGSERCP